MRSAAETSRRPAYELPVAATETCGTGLQSARETGFTLVLLACLSHALVEA